MAGDRGENLTTVKDVFIQQQNDKNRWVVNDGTDYRMIIGFLPDGEIAILISKTGEDIFDILE